MIYKKKPMSINRFGNIIAKYSLTVDDVQIPTSQYNLSSIITSSTYTISSTIEDQKIYFN